ncbi:MAG: hypothetical protein O2829_07860, partial [Bacteroidetes bacterium]|nr:hypothetical protein [Bacteroidota bacterium]
NLLFKSITSLSHTFVHIMLTIYSKELGQRNQPIPEYSLRLALELFWTLEAFWFGFQITLQIYS